MQKNSLYRFIPALDKILNAAWVNQYIERFDREFVKYIIVKVLEDIRNGIVSDKFNEKELKLKLDNLEKEFQSKTESELSGYLMRVINCTGVVVHTNIGRAPLPQALLSRALELGGRYLNLEFDLNDGVRSSRNSILDNFISKMFRGYESIVVNNNAAAVMLILNTFASGKEVIVSRGELVEIGGSFRIPEVMTKSGAILKEVGTTNKTRLSDYAEAINNNTGLIMTIHPSNYRITGFTQSVAPWELVSLAAEKCIPLYHDMGSGNMFPEDEINFPGEPNLKRLTDAGVPLISFSGDKLLGGCQAGLIIGKPELVARIRSNQLLRALRADKITYIFLEELLKIYFNGTYRKELPVFKMLSAAAQDIRVRAERLAAGIKNASLETTILEGESRVGGGAAPDYAIPTFLLGIKHKSLKPDALLKKLRNSNPPVIARLENDLVLLDLRTVFPDEEAILINIINHIS